MTSEQDVREHLFLRYSAATAARALWQWAGGLESDLTSGTTAERWDSLWSQATAHVDDEQEVTVLALVRQALFDHPGDRVLLGYLRATAASRYPQALAQADVVAACLERIAAAGCPPGALRATLEAFAAPGTDGAFASLAPAVEGRLTPAQRDALVPLLGSVGALEAVRADLLALRDQLRASTERQVGPEVTSGLAAGLARLRDDARIKDLAPARYLADELTKVLKRCGPGQVGTRGIAQARLSTLVGLKPGEPEPTVQSGRARGIAAALWATTPRPAQRPAAPAPCPAEPAPCPAEGARPAAARPAPAAGSVR